MRCRKIHMAGLFMMLAATQAEAQSTDCVLYATDYANAYVGSGDLVGDAVSGGMTGAVAGGAWRGPGGARRGARAGAALGVLDNLGSLPGGWQALYDMAYQMCIQQSNAPYGSTLGQPYQPDCRSSATVNAPMKKAPDGTIMTGSGYGDCR